MIAQERQTKILNLLGKRRRLGFGELHDLAGCSPATLRRDLTYLEERDLLVRVHGGILHPDAAAGEPSLVEKSRTAIAAKRRIAAVAAALVPDGATVFIDSGTTCLEAARLLRERSSLTIITNSLPVLVGHGRFQARLIVVGGEHRAVSGALVGNLAAGSLSRLRADVALIGASGLDPEAGPGTTELLEKDIKAGWLARSRRRILLCDATKWNSAATVCFAGWNELTDFVTDERPPSSFPAQRPKIHLS
jgi:DeoR/GlpR family transcriptional regulator of sugar metabolism